jgi:DNA-directed RNA polymerase specialized sigma24 family protein
VADSGPLLDDGLDAEFVGFVRREEDRLLPVAFLVRADLRRAERLVEDALVEVGRRWEQAVEEEPAAEVRRHVYRSAVADAAKDGSRDEAVAALSGRTGEAGWVRRERDEGEERHRDQVGRALGGLTPRQRAVLCLLALDGDTVAEAARTLHVLPRTVRGDARDAVAALARDLPGENLADGRADGPAVHWLLESAATDLPAPDLAESAARRAREAGRSVRRRSLLVAGGVVGAGAVTAVVVRRLGERAPAEPEPGTPVLESSVLDGVTVLLAPSPAQEATLPMAPERQLLGVPDPVGPGDPRDIENLPSAGTPAPVVALYLVRRERTGLSPVVQTPAADGGSGRWLLSVSVDVVDDTGGTYLGPRSISDGRRWIVLHSPGRLVVAEVSTGTWTQIPVRDPTLRVSGWSPGGRLVVARGRDHAWLADPQAGTVERMEQPVYPGRHELVWDGARTVLRTFDDDGVMSGQDEVPGPYVVPFGNTASDIGDWAAAHAFLPGPYQDEIGRSQGVVAMPAGGGPVRVLAAAFPANSTVIRYRVLGWVDGGRLLVESLTDGEDASAPTHRVLVWDVLGDRLYRVADVVGVGPSGSWFSGLWAL